MQGKIQHPFAGVLGGAPCPCGGAFWDHIPARNADADQRANNLAHVAAIQAALTALGKLIEDAPDLNRMTVEAVQAAMRELGRDMTSFQHAAEFLKLAMETE
jgi:type VI protein secretion system component VasF